MAILVLRDRIHYLSPQAQNLSHPFLSDNDKDAEQDDDDYSGFGQDAAAQSRPGD